MGKLVYPVTMDYQKEWGLWEALRECVYQEYLDLFTAFTIERVDGKLVVEGRGPTFNIPDLLLGHSNKDDTQRGQFGTGTKTGWLVLVRNGIKFTFHSGDKLYSARKGTKYDQPVMVVEWEEVEHFPGARYEIEWPKDEPLYADRVVRPGDPRILFTDPFGRSIMAETGRSNLYVKGLWVSKAKFYFQDCAFSYDLQDVQLAEDRNIPNAWSVLDEIGKLWSSVEDPDLLSQFYQAVQDGKAEKDAGLKKPAHQQAHKAAFQEIFGGRAVLQTEQALAQEAIYRGAEPINLGYSITQALSGVVESDAEYIREIEGASEIYVPDNKLDDDERKVLNMVRRLAVKVDPGLKIKVYIFSNRDKGASAQGDLMRISRTKLSNPELALSSLIHELGHQLFGAEDATAEMVQAACKVGAQLLVQYAWRG